MARYVIGLEHNGHMFKNAVIQYCQATGHEATPERVQQIYHECLSQIFSLVACDFQTFVTNLMMLPDWRTIHFLETPVDYSVIEPFRNAVRAMGIAIHQRLHARGNLDKNFLYMLESCNDTIAIVATFQDAGQV